MTTDALRASHLASLKGIADALIADEIMSEIGRDIMKIAEALSAPETPAGEPLAIGYTNWRGEWSERRIIPTGAPYWGTTEWHPEPGWLLPAIDVEKDEPRIFAMKDFGPQIAPATGGAAPTFQARVSPWMQECFGPVVSADRVERGDRFLEEVLELLQSGDYSPERVAALVAYTYGRPKGEPGQEVGGVMVTLAAYCLAHGLDMHQAGETELARINVPATIAKIREKQAAKPKGSALPVAQGLPPAPETEG